MKGKLLKHKIVLLALAALLLFPAGFSLAKYSDTFSVGTVTLNIQVPVRVAVVSKTFKNALPAGITEIIMDSYNNRQQSRSLGTDDTWETGTDIGADGSTSMVKLFTNGSTAYVLAQGDLPVTFPADCSGMFSASGGSDPTAKVERIIFGAIDTSQVTIMSSIFSGCNQLAAIENLAVFNTANVTDMSMMFFLCQGLTSLDLSGFDTSKVTESANMFFFCNKLSSVTLGKDFTLDSNLPNQAGKITGADGKWYIDKNTGYNPTDIPARTAATTYYAAASLAPAPTSTTNFSLETSSNGTITGVNTTG